MDARRLVLALAGSFFALAAFAAYAKGVDLVAVGAGALGLGYFQGAVLLGAATGAAVATTAHGLAAR